MSLNDVWKFIKKMSNEYQLLLLIALFVILVGIFWPRPMNFSAGVSAHLGNLRGSFSIEAFENSENSDKKTLVMFYAPWCGYCKKFMPAWDRFAEENKDREDVIITKINAEEFKDMAAKAGVESYPTLMYFSKGLANIDVNQVFDRAGDNGDQDVRKLNDFLASVAAVPDRRSDQAGPIDGSGPPVDLAGAPVQTPGAFIPSHFGMA